MIKKYWDEAIVWLGRSSSLSHSGSREWRTEIISEIGFLSLGIFEVHMSLLYGEGRSRSSKRLKMDIQLQAQQPKPCEFAKTLKDLLVYVTYVSSRHRHISLISPWSCLLGITLLQRNTIKLRSISLHFRPNSFSTSSSSSTTAICMLQLCEFDDAHSE